MLIALDDGHGMETAGKRTPKMPDGKVIKENQFNSAVVKYMAEHLNRCGFKTLMVAPTDADTPMKDRVRLANKHGADAYISVHYDAFDGKFDGNDPEGHTVFINPGSKKGRKLAECVLSELNKGTPQKNRGIKEAAFYVLKYTNMPAILTENGFMDNLKEAKLMASDAFRKEVAEEHARGICKYFGKDFVMENKNDVLEWAVQAQNFVVHYGISDGTRPNDPVTRAEVWEMIRRALLTDMEGVL